MIRHRWLGAASICLGLAAAGPANAYVRYETQSGNPFSWRTQTVDIVGYPHGLPSMPVEQITAALQASVSAWSTEDPDNAVCSYLKLSLTMKPESTVPPAAVNDGDNTIAIRDGDWESICSTTKQGKKVCHLPGELALTTVWSRACGEIVEADVEVNAKDFSWADLSATNNPGLQDLQNAVTHEVGHFIGLDHTCLLGALVDSTGAPIEPVDNTGAKVPFCSSTDLTPAERDATMYPSAQPGDVTKRSLSADDRQGLCEIYPKGTTPAHCGLGSGGGACTVAPEPGGHRRGGGHWLAAIAAGAGIGAAVRRRSSRR